LGILAWAGGYYESSNLWDYLLDPWLATYAIVSSALYALNRLLNYAQARKKRGLHH